MKLTLGRPNMTRSIFKRRPGARRFRSRTATAIGLSTIALLTTLIVAGTASATTTVPLGTTSPFAVLAAAGVSDVPTSTISGNVGVTPAAGSFITGLTCAEVTGTIYAVDATAPQLCAINDPGLLTTARTDLTAAYLDAFGRTPDSTLVGADNQLGGQTLVAGVYQFGHATTANLSGNLTLNGNGNADSVWIFQATSDLVTASSSTVTLEGGAQACNVFWQVGSSATLHTGSSLVGTVLSNTSIVVDGGVTVAGRLLAGAQAGSGIVTLINDTITKPTTCVSQASINAAAAAAAQAQAQAAAAAQAAAQAQAAAAAAAAAVQAANAKAAAAAAATAAAAAQAAVQAAAAAQAAAAKAAAVAAKAVVAKAAAAKAAKAAQVAKAAAAKAARAKATALKLASIRKAKAKAHAAFTG
jgi:hypothetical protein